MYLGPFDSPTYLVSPQATHTPWLPKTSYLSPRFALNAQRSQARMQRSGSAMLTSFQFLQGVTTLFGLRVSPDSRRILSLLPNSLPLPELGVARMVPSSLLYFPCNNPRPPYTHTRCYQFRLKCLSLGNSATVKDTPIPCPLSLAPRRCMEQTRSYYYY